jgi:MFS family permease
MVTQITEPGERELWFGFLSAMRNAGFGVGGLVAAVALSIGTDVAYQSVVWANAASYAVAFLLMLGVSSGGRVVPEAGQRRGPWVAFGDRAYVVLIAVILCYALAGTTLNVSMPVYFVDTLGLPGWVPGVVFVINTAMIGIGQGLVVRAMTGVTRQRVLVAAVAFTAASFAALWLIAAVVYTLGELTAGPVVAALSAEAPPPALRGRFMAATQLAWGVAGAVGPLLYSALLARGAWALWGGNLVVCVVWAALVAVLARRMPLARRAVTNAAHVAVVVDPVADAPEGAIRSSG